jgi:hypothetical protein
MASAAVPVAAAAPAAAKKPSFLTKLGQDFKGVFAFLTSTKGKAIVQLAEGVVEDIVPGAAGAINLLNSWGTEAIKTEALAAAAGEAIGTGPQKAALALQAVTPQALAFATANGLPAPTAAQLAAANDAVVAFLNIWGAIAPAPAPPAAAPGS